VAPRKKRDFAGEDLGLQVVERAFEAMQVDEPWAVREDRAFTWWGAWVRQRIWADEATASGGETLWQVRARTPALRGMPDEAETYAFVNVLNAICTMSAYAFDPDDGTVSARCGGLAYEHTIGWMPGWLVTAFALQISIAWGQVPAQVGERTLDREPHPVSGGRLDPDAMMNVAGTFSARKPPIPDQVLRRIGDRLGREGAPVRFNRKQGVLEALVRIDDDLEATWAMLGTRHPVHGPGLLVRFLLLRPHGIRRAEWLANALNLAEASDWTGEARPPALGAWTGDEGMLQHMVFLPASLLDGIGPDDAEVIVRNLLAWAGLRAEFVAERLPWLSSAAVSRYPDDEPPEGADGEDGDEEGDEAEQAPPLHERPWGPAVREVRPPSGPGGRGAARELLVDPTDPAAYGEIDDAVAAAEDGDTVRVRPGVYRKPVLLDRAVAVMADGPAGSVVLEPAGGECVGVAASGASVTGLTIRPARVGNDGTDYSAVSVRDVAVTIERCDLTTHLGATVWVGGPSSMAVVRDCTIAGGAQNGVFASEEGRVEVVRCRISGHRWPVTAHGAHSSVRAVDCELVDNLDDGATAGLGAVLVLERCVVSGNAGAGVSLHGAAPASAVLDCTITGNGGPGVVVNGGRGMRVSRNRVNRNEGGIIVDDGASPTLEANELADNADVGIGVTGDMTNPVVIDNSVTSSRPSAIVVRLGATGTFERNRLSAGDLAGIWVADDATRPVFRANIVSGGRGVGIKVSGGGSGVFEANDLRGNTDGSWDLDQPGDIQRTGNLEDAGRRPTGGAGAGDASPGRLN